VDEADRVSFPIWHAIQFIFRNGQVVGSPVRLPSLIHLTLVTLRVSAEAVAISIVVGVPIGAFLGHIHRGSFVAISLGNVWRSLPSLAVLAIGGAFLGLGLSDVLLALIVLAVPPIITNAYVAIDGAERGLVDAARGMGMTEWQILRKVELPLGVPLLMAGVRTASLFVVATTTISSLAGFSGTLGDIIVNQTSYGLAGVLGAAIVIAVMALLVDALLGGAQWALTPKPLRRADRTAASGAAAGATSMLVPSVQEPA
jgi:osmoprotectant transport system permease protein